MLHTFPRSGYCSQPWRLFIYFPDPRFMQGPSLDHRLRASYVVLAVAHPFPPELGPQILRPVCMTVFMGVGSALRAALAQAGHHWEYPLPETRAGGRGQEGHGGTRGFSIVGWRRLGPRLLS